MKDFYYDSFAESRPKSGRSIKTNREVSCKGSMERQSSKENVMNNVRKMKKQLSSQVKASSTLQVFNR